MHVKRKTQNERRVAAAALIAAAQGIFADYDGDWEAVENLVEASAWFIPSPFLLHGPLAVGMTPLAERQIGDDCGYWTVSYHPVVRGGLPYIMRQSIFRSPGSRSAERRWLIPRDEFDPAELTMTGD